MAHSDFFTQFGCFLTDYSSFLVIIVYISIPITRKIILLIRKIPAITSSLMIYHKTTQLSQVSHCGWGLSNLDIDTQGVQKVFAQGPTSKINNPSSPFHH